MTVHWRTFALLMLAVIGSVRPAYSHPLGNFTINHLAKLSAGSRELRVRYILDIAEIPTFQIMHAASDGAWTSADLTTWARKQAPFVANGLLVELDGKSARLRVRDVRARLRPGAGGLPILYWVGDFTASLPPGAHRVAFRDAVYVERRIGWKDVIVAPQTEPTQELQHYPSAMIGSPRRVSTVTFTLGTDDIARDVLRSSDDEAAAAGGTSLARSDALAQMFSSNNRTPLFVLLTIVVAFGLGALHAIEPGHGKALLAFTLVGSRATIKQAMILAASLTFAHTIGVFVLGIIVFSTASFVSESIYPWITLLSGIAVAIIGARNLSRSVHTHGHEHAHAAADSRPIDFRGAVIAAMSGGVAPCPAAIVVMLAALRLHHVGYGMLLIVIFSMGLAAVLAGLGIAVVHGSALITCSGRFDRLVKAGPLLSATLISLVGAVMIGQGFNAQGISVSPWLVAALVCAAIAGYALTPAHAHTHTVESA